MWAEVSDLAVSQEQHLGRMRQQSRDIAGDQQLALVGGRATISLAAIAPDRFGAARADALAASDDQR